MTAGCDGFKLRPGEPTPEIMIDGSPVPEGQRAVTILSRDTLDIKVPELPVDHVPEDNSLPCQEQRRTRPYTRAEFIAAMDGGMTHLVHKNSLDVFCIQSVGRSVCMRTHGEIIVSVPEHWSLEGMYNDWYKLDGSIVGVHETQ